MHFSKFRGLRFECRDMITFVYITLQDEGVSKRYQLVGTYSCICPYSVHEPYFEPRITLQDVNLTLHKVIIPLHSIL